MKAIAKSAKPTSIISSKSKPNRDTDRGTDHKQCTWIQEYIDSFDEGRMSPVPDKFLDRLAEELIEYAETTDVLRLEWFFSKRRMSAMSGYNWSKRHERFAKAHRDALLILGMRREKRALDRDAAETTTLKVQYLFDHLYEQVRQDEKQTRIEIGIEVAKATAAAKVQADNDNRPGAIPLGPVNSKEYQEYVKQIEAMQANKDPVE